MSIFNDGSLLSGTVKVELQPEIIALVKDLHEAGPWIGLTGLVLAGCLVLSTLKKFSNV